MKTEEINNALAQIATMKAKLEKLNDEKEITDLSEKINQSEVDFELKYGSKLKEVFMDVHDEICPDDKVLPPTEYIADTYLKRGDNFLVDGSQGVKVQSDDFPKEDTKLVLMPNPLRVMVNIDEFDKERVWSAEKHGYLY